MEPNINENTFNLENNDKKNRLIDQLEKLKMNLNTDKQNNKFFPTELFILNTKRYYSLSIFIYLT